MSAMSSMSKIHYRTTGGRKVKKAPAPPSVLAVIKECEAAKRKISSTASKQMKKFKAESGRSNQKNIENEDPFQFFSLSHPPNVKEESHLQKNQLKHIQQKPSTATSEKVRDYPEKYVLGEINKHQIQKVAFVGVTDENKCLNERNAIEFSPVKSDKKIIQGRKRESFNVKEVEKTDPVKSEAVADSITRTTKISTVCEITNTQTFETEELQRKNEQFENYDTQQSNNKLNINICKIRLNQEKRSVSPENILTAKEKITAGNSIENNIEDLVIKNVSPLIVNGDKNSTITGKEFKKLNEKLTTDSNDLETRKNTINICSENKGVIEKGQVTKERSSSVAGNNDVNIALVNKNIEEVIIMSQKSNDSIILSQVNNSGEKISENKKHFQNSDDDVTIVLTQATNDPKLESHEKIKNPQHHEDDLIVLTQAFHSTDKDVHEKKNSSKYSENLTLTTGKSSPNLNDKRQKLQYQNDLTAAIGDSTALKIKGEDHSQKNSQCHTLLNIVSTNKELLTTNEEINTAEEIEIKRNTEIINNEKALHDKLYTDNVIKELHKSQELPVQIRYKEKELNDTNENEIKVEHNVTVKETEPEDTKKISSSPLLFDNTPPNETVNLPTHNDDNAPINKPMSCLAELDEDLGVSTSQLKQLENEYNQKKEQQKIHVPTSYKVPVWNEPAVRSTLPPLPNFTFDWTVRAQQNRQKLQSVVQDISRLNAVLARARREIWHPSEHSSKLKGGLDRY